MGKISPIIEAYEGDITKLAVDAVVSAASETLTHGGGVAKAIENAAGPGLLEECRILGGCPVGEARVTGGHDLPCNVVVHTVGPVWRGGRFGEKSALARCYSESIRLARAYGAESIAFPAISTGKFKFPVALAADIAVKTVLKEAGGPTPLRLALFCCFGKESLDAHRAALASLNA